MTAFAPGSSSLSSALQKGSFPELLLITKNYPSTASGCPAEVLGPGKAALPTAGPVLIGAPATVSSCISVLPHAQGTAKIVPRAQPHAPFPGEYGQLGAVREDLGARATSRASPAVPGLSRSTKLGFEEMLLPLCTDSRAPQNFSSLPQIQGHPRA